MTQPRTSCRRSRHLACHLTTESSLVTMPYEFDTGYHSIVDAICDVLQQRKAASSRLEASA